ncbi:type II secretion system F family protein [Cellulosilyticum sp. I15G10I2]|uniref:type II secretion system F family protein n=1 Tax=Cellulosilyticum sp. I15G10I2 TaxID=1892843 RepID=UPI00085CAFE3|nr:type II secretion system F family protein [Cellulosilyticum sp. I15G10I2]
METYLYKAKDVLKNKVVRGEIETESEEQVKRFLADKYLYPLSIRKKTALNSDVGDIAFFQKPIKMADITFFCKQFAAMVQAGISVGRSLEICAEQASHKTLKKHIMNLHEEVNRGKTLSEAAADEKIFPDLLVSMIECGEASGNLDVVLNQVVDHFDIQLGTTRKLKKALTYPALVLVVVGIVVFVMMVKVIPNFVAMFQDADIELPLPTQIVIALSNFFAANWLGIIIFTALLAVLGFNIKKIPGGRKTVDQLSLKLPLFGPLNKKTMSALFAKTLSMLVASGLPMLQAMEIIKKVLNNAIAEDELDDAIELLKHGNTLHEALRGSQIYPPIMYSMISIGEETGALDEMLVKIGNYFNDEVQTTIDSLMVLIEPILTIFIAFIVGGIMLAVILPTFTAAAAMM